MSPIALSIISDLVLLVTRIRFYMSILFCCAGSPGVAAEPCANNLDVWLWKCCHPCFWTGVPWACSDRLLLSSGSVLLEEVSAAWISHHLCWRRRSFCIVVSVPSCACICSYSPSCWSIWKSDRKSGFRHMHGREGWWSIYWLFWRHLNRETT